MHIGYGILTVLTMIVKANRAYVKRFLVFIRYCVYTVIKICCGGIKMLGYISVQQAAEK